MVLTARRAIASTPDALTAATFATVWIAPQLLGIGWVPVLMAAMVLEFLAIHAGAIIGTFLLDSRRSRSTKTRAIAGLGAFYLLFVLGVALTFGQPWVIASFAWLLFAKAVTVWTSPVPREAEAMHQRRLWGVSGAAYLFGALATVLLPLPALGITPEVVADLGLTATGLWVEEPQRLLAFGTIYFAILAAVKWRDATPGTAAQVPASLEGSRPQPPAA